MNFLHSTTPWEVRSTAAQPHSHSAFDIFQVGMAKSAGRIAHVPASEAKPTMANAEFIVRACNAHDQLAEALLVAKRTIRALHGENAWDIYDRASPEMKKINAAISQVMRPS